MKLEKNKIVFASALLCAILFIIAYAMLVMGEEEDQTIQNNQVPVPKLDVDQKEYQSKLDAINDLKEVRQTNAPSMYDERLLDSMGYYNPELDSIRKKRIIDSVYFLGKKRYQNLTALRQLEGDYTKGQYQDPIIKTVQKPKPLKRDTVSIEEKQGVRAKELGLEHQLFFASNPQAIKVANHLETKTISVLVDGTQTVKAKYRLRMRLMEDVAIDGMVVPKNTMVYGFVSFQPNRAIIDISNIGHHQVRLKAYDLQDGNEGIYVENSFKGDATKEVVDDVVQDINIAGVPQVGGVKKIFQRNNRHIKVTILNNYRLILKANNK